MSGNGATPRQRDEGLVVRALAEETLVLDSRSDVAHCLSPEMSRVWDACTGTNTLAEVAQAAGLDESATATAVEELAERDLLEFPAGIDRRKLLRRSALVGASAVAAYGITSVAIPAAAMAQSPAHGLIVISGQHCGTSLNSGGNPATTNTFLLSLNGVPPGNYVVNLMFTGSDVPSGSILQSGSVTSPAVLSINLTVPPGSQTSNEVLINAAGANFFETGNAGPLPAEFMINAQIIGASAFFMETENVTINNAC